MFCGQYLLWEFSSKWKQHCHDGNFVVTSGINVIMDFLVYLCSCILYSFNFCCTNMLCIYLYRVDWSHLKWYLTFFVIKNINPTEVLMVSNVNCLALFCSHEWLCFKCTNLKLSMKLVMLFKQNFSYTTTTRICLQKKYIFFFVFQCFNYICSNWRKTDTKTVWFCFL